MNYKLLLLITCFLLQYLAIAQPSTPQNVNAAPNVVCPGSSTDLSATVTAPNVVRWYTQASGGIALGTSASGANFSVTPNGTTIYYAETVTPSGGINFSHTGNVQSWTVPAGVTSITVDAYGASGVDGTTPFVGGNGGRTQATLAVTPGQVLYINVGGQGGASTGGFNGGGATGTRRGGGATDIRTTNGVASSRILVAGGGGAASSSANGGNGGNAATAGANGVNFNSTVINGGGAATTAAAGAAGTGVANGAAGTSAGVGGLGGNSTGTTLLCGGNGGGGYFGGGGGGANSTGNNKSAGGGGGSSFVPAGTDITYTSGVNDGNGSISITWSGTPSTSREPVTVTEVTAPSNIQVANITATSADISWASTQGVGYEWKIVATGAGVNATAIAEGSTPFLTVTANGLSTNTNYDVYVRSECSGSTFSAWSSAVALNTSVSCSTPATFTMTGGGTFCDNGGTGVAVGLDGSELGVNYYLYFDALPYGVFEPGTGSAINFGDFTIDGTYTVEARDAITETCIATMTGSSVVLAQMPDIPEVSIAITAGSQSMLFGASVTFTATPINGGTTPTYQWKVNGTNAGTDSVNFSTTSLLDGDEVTCEMISNGTCVSPSSALSTGIVVSITNAGKKYVNINATGANTGNSWADAYTDLQTAINAANAGAAIWVATGTYKPTQDPSGNTNPTDPRDKTFYLKNGVKIYGGFAGTETLLSQRDWNTNYAILSGDIGTNITTDNAYHVVLSLEDDTTTVLDGFFIQNGNANDDDQFTRFIIVDGRKVESHYGGGYFGKFSSPTIANTTFLNNLSKGTGGMNNDSSSSPIIYNCVFRGNEGDYFTGAMTNSYGSSPRITNSIFINNTSNGLLGGLYNNNGSNPVVTNCIFTGNEGPYGAIANLQSAPIFINTTVVGNTGTAGAGGIVNISASAGLTNCIIWGNTGVANPNIDGTGFTVTYSTIEGASVYAGTGNSNADPLFADIADAIGVDDIWFTGDDGLVLSCASPAFNTGTSTGAPALDIAGAAIYGASKDMGAYESQVDLAIPPAPTITSSNNSPCLGASVTLTGSTAGEYAWFRNGTFVKYANTSADYTFNALAGTNNYTLLVISSGGICPSSQSVSTTVTSIAPSAILTPATMPPYCINTAPVLNANTGTNYTYSWVGTSPSAATTTGSAFTPTHSGNHRVIVTDENGCSKSSAWMGIVLNALPGANAGTDKTVCIGSSTGLGTIATANYSYAWSPSIDLSSATSATPTFTASTPSNTNYTLTVTNNLTGCTRTDVVGVNAVALPATPALTSTSSPVCQGATITLIPSGFVGAINWYKNGSLINTAATAAQRTINTSTASADSYTIQAKSGNCLSGLSNAVSVWIQPAPTPTLSATPAIVSNLVSICNPGQTSGTAQLTANLPSGSPTAALYNWQQVVAGLATNVSPAATTSSYTASVATTPTTQNNKVFRAQVTYSNGCVKNTSNVTVKMLPSTCTARTGQADDLTTETFTAYPNPTEGILTVVIENSIASQGKIVLYNTLGQIVTSYPIALIQGRSEERLDLTNLTSGVYTLSFQTANGNKIQKIVKE